MTRARLAVPVVATGPSGTVVLDALHAAFEFNNALAERSHDLGQPGAEQQQNDSSDDNQLDCSQTHHRKGRKNLMHVKTLLKGTVTHATLLKSNLPNSRIKPTGVFGQESLLRASSWPPGHRGTRLPMHRQVPVVHLKGHRSHGRGVDPATVATPHRIWIPTAIQVG